MLIFFAYPSSSSIFSNNDPTYFCVEVLTTKWIDGERLDKSSKEDITFLCSVAMNSYLTMMLEGSVTIITRYSTLLYSSVPYSAAVDLSLVLRQLLPCFATSVSL